MLNIRLKQEGKPPNLPQKKQVKAKDIGNVYYY